MTSNIMKAFLVLSILCIISSCLAAPVIANIEYKAITSNSHRAIHDKLSELFEEIERWRQRLREHEEFYIRGFTSWAEDNILSNEMTFCCENKCPYMFGEIDLLNHLNAIFPTDGTDICWEVIRTRKPSYVSALRLNAYNQANTLRMIKALSEFYYTPARSKSGRRSLDLIFIARLLDLSRESRKNEMLLSLYEKPTTPVAIIYENYDALMKKKLSFELLSQFIEEGKPYVEFYSFFKIVKPSRARRHDSSSSQDEKEEDSYEDKSNIIPSTELMVETTAINEQLQKFRNMNPTDAKQVSIFLEERAIPYMNKIDNMDVEPHETAFQTVKEIFLLLKTAASEHYKNHFFSTLVNVPSDNVFTLPKSFFENTLFLEFGIIFHRLSVKKNFFDLQRNPLDSEEDLVTFIAKNAESVQLIRKYQFALDLESKYFNDRSTVKLKDLARKAYKILKTNLDNFSEETTIIIKNLEELAVFNEPYLEVAQMKDKIESVWESPMVELLCIRSNEDHRSSSNSPMNTRNRSIDPSTRPSILHGR